MVLKSIELNGFKSFGKKSTLVFDAPVTGIVGPNGSGKSNVVESIRFVLGEQSIKSLRGKGGTDLIFKGSKQLASLNRASVTIVFDNSKKVFTFADSTDTKTKMVSYDEVRITREVYGDGTNKYLINGSEVRLKDIIELLSSVNIGSSGHHIISQGEADRILSSNSRDRRIMIEDALGLKIYQYRIKETERRLLKTESNMKEIAALKRELAPHLIYLKKQVEKIQKTEGLRSELINLYTHYCNQEQQTIYDIQKDFTHRKTILQSEYSEINNIFYKLETEKKQPPASLFEKAYLDVVHQLSEFARLKNELERSLGRLEGTKEALTRPAFVEKKQEKLLPFSFIKNTFYSVTSRLDQICLSNDLTFVHSIAKEIRVKMLQDLDEMEEKEVLNNLQDSEEQIGRINDDIVLIEQKIIDIENKKQGLEVQKQELEAKMDLEKNEYATAQKGYYEIVSKKESVEMRIQNLDREQIFINSRKESFENELREGLALLGSDMPTIRPEEGISTTFEGVQLEEIKRKIERIKIKLEESGGLGGGDTLKEYDSTVERDQFLAKELTDLEYSIIELRKLIADLKVKLDGDFKQGIEKINYSFNKFFSLMFGGGNASLSISVEHKRKKSKEDEEDIDVADIPLKDEEDMEFERGIDIHVSLPQKKVKELSMLSGGERSLTSIALLFAMSQVNPPPFLVLDETDAALDEANSRRYGDMIENLSEFSQLIVVTHNRETMSRAGILYGVTVGFDGASKLLSIKFNDAVEYAK